MKVLSIKKYNKMQIRRWEERWIETMEEVKVGAKYFSELPQLAFYIFNKSYGYVAFNHDMHKSLWAKTKKEVINRWENEQGW